MTHVRVYVCVCVSYHRWVFATRYAKQFDTNLRHNVYADLSPDANYLALASQVRYTHTHKDTHTHTNRTMAQFSAAQPVASTPQTALRLGKEEN